MIENYYMGKIYGNISTTYISATANKVSTLNNIESYIILHYII